MNKKLFLLGLVLVIGIFGLQYSGRNETNFDDWELIKNSFDVERSIVNIQRMNKNILSLQSESEEALNVSKNGVIFSILGEESSTQVLVQDIAVSCDNIRSRIAFHNKKVMNDSTLTQQYVKTNPQVDEYCKKYNH